MGNPAEDTASPMLQGQVIRRSRHRQAAIVLLDGRLWVADFIDGGYLAAHVRRMRSVYAARRDALAGACEAVLPKAARLGGLWI